MAKNSELRLCYLSRNGLVSFYKLTFEEKIKRRDEKKLAFTFYLRRDARRDKILFFVTLKVTTN